VLTRRVPSASQHKQAAGRIQTGHLVVDGHGGIDHVYVLKPHASMWRTPGVISTGLIETVR
jgi:hypothetical protein